MSVSVGERVSVCLIAYNHVELIESTVRSILDQTISGYEIIISDDCSNDGTWERILQLAHEDVRIKPIRTPHNMGMPGNANFAVAQSTRPYVALLHHDDLYRRDLLEKWADVLDRHSDAGFVFNPYGVFESDFVYEEPMPGGYMDGKWLLEHYLLARWGCVVRGTAMIRRTAWEQVGGMREQFGLLADVDLWMRLAMHGAVGYVPEPVITVRQVRPDYYPDTYSSKHWSWQRLKYLYEIHGTNRGSYYGTKSLNGRCRQWAYRLKLSMETGKWLLYAVVKKNRHMLLTSSEGATQYDLWPLRLFRRLLSSLARSLGEK